MPIKNEHEHHPDVVGILSSGTAGAMAGAGIGLVVGGPLGAAVGAGIGAVSAAVAGAVIDPEYDYESHEPTFRREFESSAMASTHAWEEASRAYRYGWESHERPEYKGKAWDQVRSDLKGAWTGAGRWDDYEFLVRSAWERRATYHGHSFLSAFERFHPSNPGEPAADDTRADRFGQALATDPGHLSDDWAAVEPEARKYWEAMNRGTWDEAKESIHHAWDQARSHS